MKKKNLFISAALFSAALLVACGGGNNTTTGGNNTPTTPATQTYNIKVWCAENLVSLTTTQLNDFKTLYPTLNVEFTVDPVGEGDAASNMMTDVEAGADVFCFPQDQLARLVSAGALAPITGTVAEQVIERNDESSVAAGTLDETLYAFPLTADNGYFMYYDKAVISEDHIDSMEEIIADCIDNNKLFSMQLSTDGGWYNAGFFFSQGCVSEWQSDSKGIFTGFTDTYNSEAGVKAMRAMNNLINSGVWNNASSVGAFNTGSAVVVSGIWDYEAAVTAFTDANNPERINDLGICELPSYTLDGTSYHIGSFSGNKLVGIKPQIDATKAAICQLIGDYLTSEKAQQERFDAVSWGPSNKVVQASQEVQANPALAALTAQAEYAIPQGQYPIEWWDYAAAIGSSLDELTLDASDAELKAILETYATAISGLIA